MFCDQAMAAVKATYKPDRGPLLTWLATVKEPQRKDCLGVYRWLLSLRLADTVVQLPCAEKVLEWIVRCFLKFYFEIQKWNLIL